MLNKSTYMVLNYNASPVSVSTRYSSVLVPAGDDHAPGGVPMSLDEIIYANNTGKAFKCGLLTFEAEYADEIYKELRIDGWRDILTNSDIYDIILNPTIEGLERVIAIEEPLYFDRIYGAYIGLRNAGADITTKVSDILKVRRKELRGNKRKSAIELRASEAQAATEDTYEDLQKKINDMQTMIDKLLSAQGVSEPKASDVKAPETEKPKAEKKKKPAAAKSAEKSAPAVKE